MLHSLFDLTPSETRVARGLAEGLQPSQIAARHCVTAETIRAQIKAIFLKTGTHRQAELTALLASIPKPPPGEVT
jgi:DNA-binding CsgD family transcriptional regulator